jgi:hypothetical protein
LKQQVNLASVFSKNHVHSQKAMDHNYLKRSEGPILHPVTFFFKFKSNRQKFSNKDKLKNLTPSSACNKNQGMRNPAPCEDNRVVSTGSLKYRPMEQKRKQSS